MQKIQISTLLTLKTFSQLESCFLKVFLASPEHLDLLRRVALTVGLARLDRPHRLRLWSVVEREVRSEGEKLSRRSLRSARTAGLGSRGSCPVLSLSCSRFGLRLFETLRPAGKQGRKV